MELGTVLGTLYNITGMRTAFAALSPQQFASAAGA